jgi:hypothetical protein
MWFKGKGIRPAREVLTIPGWREMQIIPLDSAVSRRWRPLEKRMLANLEEPEKGGV